MDLVTFTVIIDDIVYPDGHTAMACLGGGGPQTAFGARIWLSTHEKVGLAAGIGSDFPDLCHNWLKQMEIDVSGLLVWPSPTLRAWQILEDDGARTQVWRINVEDDLLGMLRPSLNDLPTPYRLSKTYHVCVHPSGRDVEFIKSLRKTGAEVVSVEVYTHALEIVTHSELRSLVSAGHIFSPNEKEASSLVGPGQPGELIDRLLELGAEIVVLRRGELGCIAHSAINGERWEVPAYHTIFQVPVFGRAQAYGNSEKKGVMDPTGCGNTFCGGFLAGWWKTKDLLSAALWGSVSASFMLEYEGVPPAPISELKTEAILRLQALRSYCRKI